MVKKNILFSFGLILFNFLLYAKSVPSEKNEASNENMVSFFFTQETDTLLNKEYILIKKLFEKREYPKALEESLKLLKLSKERKDIKTQILINYLIGEIFTFSRNYNKSLFYYKESTKIYKQLNEVSHLDKFKLELDRTGFHFVDNLFKIGSSYHNLKEIDSAKYYYNKVIKIESLDNLFLEIKAKAYNNLSNIYFYYENPDFKKAESYALKSIEIKKKLGDKISEAISLSSLAGVYLEKKEYQKAKKFYLIAINLIENNNDDKSVKYKEIFYDNISWAMYNQKDYKAYNYLDKSFNIRDSLRSAEIQDILLQIEAKHKENIQAQKILLKESEVELEKAQERKTNWFLGALMILILGISGVILYNYKLRQNNLKLKLVQTQFAQESKLEKLKSESQVRILNATLDGKETERKQIAETLHDSVSSLLSSANLHLQATKMQFNGDTPIEIDKTQKIIIEASQTIRDLSHTLVSSVLLKFGLKYAIIDMAEKYSNSQIQINTDIKNLRRYHQNFEIKVNNIIQEFVNNVLKHSKASKAIVRIEDKEGKLIINIQDNGIGFDKKKIPEKDGLGINQIDARIQMMKGEFNIDSNSENGTKIAIVLPILEKEIPIRV